MGMGSICLWCNPDLALSHGEVPCFLHSAWHVVGTAGVLAAHIDKKKPWADLILGCLKPEFPAKSQSLLLQKAGGTQRSIYTSLLNIHTF